MASVVVIGAGPAGIAAAEAAAASAPVVVVDEQPRPVEMPAGVDARTATSAWALFPGPVVATHDAAGASEIAAGAVVIATGSVDRAWPMSGWHLDGVLTSREAILDVPHGAIGVVGPEATAVAAALVRRGGAVAVTVPDIASARIAGERRVERLGDVPVDAVVLALGRVPDADLALQARAASAFDRRTLTERPLLAPDGATSVPGVFVAGEAAGIAGDDAARAHGAAVGRAAARVANGGAQASTLAPPKPWVILPLPLPSDPATVIDRHQRVGLAALREAIADGAFDVNDLRRRTRAGMGAGREILPVLAALLLEADPAIPDTRLTARERPPIRPLPFSAVLATEGVP